MKIILNPFALIVQKHKQIKGINIMLDTLRSDRFDALRSTLRTAVENEKHWGIEGQPPTPVKEYSWYAKIEKNRKQCMALRKQKATLQTELAQLTSRRLF
jgi:hypothetical protein